MTGGTAVRADQSTAPARRTAIRWRATDLTGRLPTWIAQKLWPPPPGVTGTRGEPRRGLRARRARPARGPAGERLAAGARGQMDPRANRRAPGHQPRAQRPGLREGDGRAAAASAESARARRLLARLRARVDATGRPGGAR